MQIIHGKTELKEIWKYNSCNASSIVHIRAQPICWSADAGLSQMYRYAWTCALKWCNHVVCCLLFNNKNVVLQVSAPKFEVKFVKM